MTKSGGKYGEGREALLRATIAVVARDGLRGFTYRAVAREAGVSNTLIAHHFGSADALLLAAFELAAVTPYSAGVDEGNSDLDQFARNVPQTVLLGPELQVFQYIILIESRRDPALRPLVEKIYDTYRNAVRRELMRLGWDEPTDALAAGIFAMVDGLILQQIVFGNVARTEDALERLRQLLADAATARG
ncbi:MAG TPA: TetR family transcriptional regulator C-terminal domain-containing protein [Pseudolysinimonas sp.]|nr:TetR family transcriptional regulator C-terminal domain-containing protein [Pseudolysinimonas sp.]